MERPARGPAWCGCRVLSGFQTAGLEVGFRGIDDSNRAFRASRVQRFESSIQNTSKIMNWTCLLTFPDRSSAEIVGRFSSFRVFETFTDCKDRQTF